MGAIMPLLQSTMSLSLIKGLLSDDGQDSSLSYLVFWFFFLKLTWKSSKLNLYLDHLFAKCSLLLPVSDGKFGVTEGKCKIFIYFQSHARCRREWGKEGGQGGGGTGGEPSGQHVLSILAARHAHRQLFIRAKLASEWKREAGFETNVQQNQVSRQASRVMRVHVLRGPRAACLLLMYLSFS